MQCGCLSAIIIPLKRFYIHYMTLTKAFTQGGFMAGANMKYKDRVFRMIFGYESIGKFAGII